MPVCSGKATTIRNFAKWLAPLLLIAAFFSSCQNYLSTTLTTGPAGNSPFITVNPGGTIPVDVGKSIQITALVSGDNSGEGVTWTLNGAGTLSSTTIFQTTYTAPSTGVGTAIYLTATSVATPTEFFTSTLVVTAFPSFVTTSMPGGTEGATYDNIITVTAGAPPFVWSIVSGSLPPGLNFSVGSLNSLEILGVPPKGSAGTYNFTVQVTDATGGTAKQAFSIVIAAATSGNAIRSRLLTNPAVSGLAGDSSGNSMLSGQYAFLFNGKNNGATVASAGSFSADGAGNITGGIADRNGPAGPQTALGFSGTYNIGANRLGMMFLDFADGTSAAYAVAANSQGGARFIEFDDLTGTGTRGAGEISKQDITAFSMAKLAGNYAFALNGSDTNQQPLPVIGTMTTLASGSFKGGELDSANSRGTASGVPLSGTFSVDAIGRGLLALNPSSSPALPQGTWDLSLYVVSASKWYVVETDGSGKPVLDGIVTSAAAPLTQLASVAKPAFALPSGGEVVLGVPISSMAFITDSTSAGPFRINSIASIFAGADEVPAGALDSPSLMSVSFDGNGGVVMQSASSSANGLALSQPQTGTYSASSTAGNQFSIGGFADGTALTGMFVSASKLNLLLPSQNGAAIIVEK